MSDKCIFTKQHLNQCSSPGSFVILNKISHFNNSFLLVISMIIMKSLSGILIKIFIYDCLPSVSSGNWNTSFQQFVSFPLHTCHQWNYSSWSETWWLQWKAWDRSESFWYTTPITQSKQKSHIVWQIHSLNRSIDEAPTIFLYSAEISWNRCMINREINVGQY